MKWSKHISANYNSRGFTLAELLMALIVTSIILGAVATLTYAFGAAYDAGDDTTLKQAHVRYATLRISELFRNCKLVFDEISSYETSGVWRADDNEDGQINADEVVCVYVGSGSDSDYLMFVEFSGVSNPAYSDLESIILDLILSGLDIKYTTLIPQCSNVQFVTDSSPPWTRIVSISFDLEENGVTHHYQINTALRAWAGNLLNEAGDAIVSDDD